MIKKKVQKALHTMSTLDPCIIPNIRVERKSTAFKGEKNANTWNPCLKYWLWHKFLLVILCFFPYALHMMLTHWLTPVNLSPQYTHDN